MYVGQQLQIESGTNGETVTVQSITNSTQFVATFARTHASTKTVQAHVITTSQIAADIAFVINAVNPTQLSSSVGGITATTDDLTDEVYEDKYPADILSKLADQLNWAVGVDTARRLYLRPRSGRSWFVDATDLQVQRSLSALRNDAYAVYQDAAGNTLRTANNPQSTRYSITRRAAVTAQTTSATLAATIRDTSLANTKTCCRKHHSRSIRSLMNEARRGRCGCSTGRHNHGAQLAARSINQRQSCDNVSPHAS
jgi:hypothetical protein